MAIFHTIKAWQPETPGENLFLYVYGLLEDHIPVEKEIGWGLSSLALIEFYRIVAAMDLTHRSLNIGVSWLSANKEASISSLIQELSSGLEVSRTHRFLAPLAELVRLAALAYIGRNLSRGQKNLTHRDSIARCCWCWKHVSRTEGTPKEAKATVEHIWPEFLGGTSNSQNLTIACGDCNTARQHAYTWAWFGVQAMNEKLDANDSLPKELKLAVALHRLMKVASGQTKVSSVRLTLKEATLRLKGVIPEIRLAKDQRYTFLEIIKSAAE